MGFLSSKIMDCFPDLNEDLLMRTLFEMNRFYDMNLKNYFSDYKKKFGITLDSFQRKVLRNYYYYGNKEVLEDLKIEEFPEIEFNELDIEKINSLTIEKLKLPTKDKIVKSIYSRVDEFNKFNKEKIKAKKWLDMRKVKTSYSFVALNIDQDFLDKNRNYEQNIYGLVNYVYESLENYRYCAVVINEKLKKDGIDISWNLLSKIAIYMENFIQFKKDFFPFKRKKKIEELTSFLENNRNLRKTDFEKIVSDFYTNISTGFVFTDLLLSDNQETKILIMRKIELDESPVLCPSCLEKTGRGNSYPMMFLKSWECQNPNCPERSKSGRGKRYDEYGIYRYFKLVENDSKNVISRDLYSKWRRDIFDNSLDIFKMLYMYYTWNGEKVLVINRLTDSSDYNGRKVEYRNIEKIELKPSVDYSELPIVKLFRLILQNYLPSQQKNKIESEMSILNEDSISGLAKLCKNQIKYANNVGH